MIDRPSKCSDHLDPDRITLILYLLTSVGAACVLLCTVVIVLVLALRLHRILVYRLAAYQVFSALLYGITCILQVFSATHNEPASNSTNENSPFCQASGLLVLYLQWVKLMLTACVTAHLFCFVVYYRNLKKCELVYVLGSTLIPSVIVIVPLITKSYGMAGAWCGVQDWIDNCPLNFSRKGVIEQFALWLGPATILCVVNSVAVVVMAIVLLRRATSSHREKWQQHKEALGQMLPLMAYPITYSVLLVVPFVTRVYMARPHLESDDYTMMALTAVCMPLWGFTAGAALLVHICVMKVRKQKKTNKGYYGSTDSNQVTFNSSNGSTFFEPPRSSTI